MKWKCERCGFGPVDVETLPVYCVCQTVADLPAHGPGTELKNLLRLFGTRPAGCDCETHAATMNARGCQWCAENLETIVGWLRDAASKRGLPFLDTIARRLVRRAIKNAQQVA